MVHLLPTESEKTSEYVRNLIRRVEEAEAANEFDRSKLYTGVKKMIEVLRGREWMASGRGCYEWDDDRWYKEFGEAFTEIHEVLTELAKVAHNFHASTYKNGTRQSISEARIDIKKNLAIAERALMIAAEDIKQKTTCPEGVELEYWSNHWKKIAEEQLAKEE